MSEWNVQIVRIDKVEKHPDADLLSIATVLGDYPVIIKTGDYQVGDTAAYLPIDSIVPDTEDYYFLCPKKYESYEENGEIKQRVMGPKYPLGSVPEKNRIIKAKRLRGIFSMGMLVNSPGIFNIGTSVDDIMGITKWIEEEEDNLKISVTKGGNAESPPKGWAIPYYDIEGLRRYSSCIKDDEEVVVSEKLHGSNYSAVFDGNRLYVKSRNYYKKRDEDSMWWDPAIRYDLENKLQKYPMMAFFFECVGQVKKFRYDAELTDGTLKTKLYMFDLYDLGIHRYANYDLCVEVAKDVGLDMVPLLYRGPWNKELAYQHAEGLTTLGGKHIREGIVIKPVKERYDERLKGRLVLKLVGEGYSLQK